MTLAQSLNLVLRRSTLVAGFCLLAILGCRGVVSSGTGEEQGKLALWITDAPVTNADRVEITITAVDIKPREQEAPIEIVLDRPLVVDLLKVVDRPNRREKIFDNQALPVGAYDWIELKLDQTRLFIEVEGSQYPLVIPEDQLDGLRIPFGVVVNDDTRLDLTIDFDLRKSLRDRGDNNYELHPTLRTVRTERTGTLDGLVAEELIRTPFCNNGPSFNEGNVVYVYSGTANFQDIQGTEGDPVATAPVLRRPGSSEYEFIVGFLPRGNYTAVFSCDGSLDDPDEDNSLAMTFSEPINVTIHAGQTTSIFFEFAF